MFLASMTKWTKTHILMNNDTSRYAFAEVLGERRLA